MSKFSETIEKLTDDQQQLLADTIIHGEWGDCEMTFLDENGKDEDALCTGYCTNDAKNGGHFSGRKVSTMFRSIYNKVELQPGTGEIICHCNDWWGDGSGDMMFIREPYDAEARQWALEYNKK